MNVTRTEFLKNRDETGRHIVTSLRTGVSYYVEPVGDTKTNWGSVDPATGKMMKKKGHAKYRGSVDEKDSIVTEENGFKNVVTLGVGYSPMGHIEEVDKTYPDK